MRVALLLALLSGCAPLLTVKREQRAALSFEAERQPIEVTTSDTGIAVIDLLNTFSDKHWRALHAAEQVRTQLQAAGVAIAPSADVAKSQLVVRVVESRVSTAGGTPSASAELFIEQGGVLLTKVEGEAHGAEMEGRLFTLAIEDAAQKLSAKLRSSEETETFVLERGEELEAANELLLDGQLQAAIAAYQTILETRPKHVSALVNLSAARFASGDFAGAVDAARRAAEADTSARRLNRENHAADLAAKAQRTTRVVSFTTFGGPKKKAE